MKTKTTEQRLYFRLESHERAMRNGEAAQKFEAALRYIAHPDFNPLSGEWSVPAVYAQTIETKRQIFLTDEPQGILF